MNDVLTITYDDVHGDEPCLLAFRQDCERVRVVSTIHGKQARCIYGLITEQQGVPPTFYSLGELKAKFDKLRFDRWQQAIAIELEYMRLYDALLKQSG